MKLTSPETYWSGTSSSGYDEDLLDMDLEMSSELCLSEQKILSKHQLTRQSAVDPVHIRPRPSITIVSPDSLCIDILSPNHDTDTCPRAPLSPEIFITPQSSIESRYFVTPQTSFDARDVACFPPVIGEEDFNLNHNHNLSEFYLSELSLKCQNDNEPIVLLNTESVKRKRKRKKSDKSFDVDEGMETLPILGGFSVALCLGAPVYLASNIKLALFAAIGGGIMGYTTGKMFSDWGEQDAKIKGEYQEMTGNEPKNIRKKRVMRRIQEYKKFRGNCQRLREFITEKHQLNQREINPQETHATVRRSKSQDVLGKTVKNDRQMGRLCVSSPNLSQDLTLQESIYLWRLKRNR